MLIIALVLALIGLVALVFAVVTSNELVAWVCIGASVLGVVLLIVDALRERQHRDASDAAETDDADDADAADDAADADAAAEQPDTGEEPVDYPEEDAQAADEADGDQAVSAETTRGDDAAK
ncbi:hypothetical protein [Mycobacterium sherrisii]|uniref:Transmembrane protein n=1 Tax=Mycobacterium sherrisii TaxID=243061 RepID=A0A1E3SXV8_9MYCO|nr:hypothetical protein [Mycobacterium sherrisii]MCV7028936.1 hypothetical protein [Mycobacterium sherrisii]ODR06438.1 hypothetical protein BHQ21_11660 [Mycobacterium sherrisii]ORW80192.1 hypothetical protein AWC25_04080 [Mycobacterium sherrisii]